MLHYFTHSVDSIELPEQFTYPFHYTPHPLCIFAAQEVQTYLASQLQWAEELHQGKMFGVLVVETPAGKVGYLAAFSGTLAGQNIHPYFVPPVYDLLQPSGFFRHEEKNISALNSRIEDLQNHPDYLQARQRLEEAIHSSHQALSQAQAELKASKEARELRRQNHPDENELAEMIRESQHQKAEYKRLERTWKERLAALKEETDTFETLIQSLKTERKKRSATLQQKLFEQFEMLNARGEKKNLCAIFAPTTQKIPPAGAGECAAPKLLQYAYLHQLRPVAMAEFWWGISPKAEIRRHGYYYPACQGKCGPILGHMLQGLNVEPSPLAVSPEKEIQELEILWEDEYLLVVNKPAGMLSVPGKREGISVYSWLKGRYPQASGPIIVHRLDMATSGLLLAAKTKEVHQNLQAQFKNRTIKKRYVALLEGHVTQKEGIIDLPLCPDITDRPRQMVNREYGKPALTKYHVDAQYPEHTRITFYPLTGRTHQLRVHAAHPQGLNCPIAGDELYGKKADRLYLHAESIEFTHPISGERISVEKKAEFVEEKEGKEREKKGDKRN